MRVKFILVFLIACTMPAIAKQDKKTDFNRQFIHLLANQPVPKDLKEKFDWMLTRMRVERPLFQKKFKNQGFSGGNRIPTSVRAFIPSLRFKQSFTQASVLERVNQHINKFAYKSDIKNFGVSDYWASPMETLLDQSGDCEDLALAKIQIVQLLFRPSEARTYLALLEDRKKNEKHAVAIISTKTHQLVLDNQAKNAYNIVSLPAHYVIDYVLEIPNIND